MACYWIVVSLIDGWEHGGSLELDVIYFLHVGGEEVGEPEL